jgi:outer membrane lipoprotein
MCAQVYSDLMMEERCNPGALVALLVLFASVVLGMASCASVPKFDLADVEQSVNPRDVVTQVETYKSKKVLWGGVIIDSVNVKDGTQLEVLVYPLDRNSKPEIEKNNLGRIIAFHHGYLETVDYAAGRLLTLVGIVQETKKGSVGEAMYTYPVVSTDQLHLWPPTTAADDENGVHFGIGIMIH